MLLAKGEKCNRDREICLPDGLRHKTLFDESLDGRDEAYEQLGAVLRPSDGDHLLLEYPFRSLGAGKSTATGSLAARWL